MKRFSHVVLKVKGVDENIALTSFMIITIKDLSLYYLYYYVTYYITFIILVIIIIITTT